MTFQMTFLETNVKELPDVVRLAAHLGVDRVKGHHLWAHFQEVADLSLRCNSESIARWNSAVQQAYDAADRYRLPGGEKVQLDNLFPLAESASEDIAPDAPCPFLGKEAWVSAQGRFDPCCAPDALRRSLGDFGNLNDRNLSEVWESQPYRQLVATYKSKRLCKGCNMRRPVQE